MLHVYILKVFAEFLYVPCGDAHGGRGDVLGWYVYLTSLGRVYIL